MRNDADESALQSAIRVALGRPAARGAGGGLCAALTVMRAFAVENLSSQVISSCLRLTGSQFVRYRLLPGN